MAEDFTVTRVGNGVYRFVDDGRAEIVYVAGTADDRWVCWNGRVYRGDFSDAPRARRSALASGAQTLTAPMPATVVSVPVKPGDAVKKGDIIVLLEAMKMELPIRAMGDAVVAAVHCREGELVQADAILIELT